MSDCNMLLAAAAAVNLSSSSTSCGEMRHVAALSLEACQTCSTYHRRLVSLFRHPVRKPFFTYNCSMFCHTAIRLLSIALSQPGTVVRMLSLADLCRSQCLLCLRYHPCSEHRRRVNIQGIPSSLGDSYGIAVSQTISYKVPARAFVCPCRRHITM